MEAIIHTVVHHSDPLWIDPVALRYIIRGVLRDRHDPFSLPGIAGKKATVKVPCPIGKIFRILLEVQVMDDRISGDPAP